MRQLFLRRVTLGEVSEDTRRRVLWSELVFTRDIDDPLQYVLDIYGKYRLLTFETDPQTREPTVEVAHGALIRHVGRLRGVRGRWGAVVGARAHAGGRAVQGRRVGGERGGGERGRGDGGRGLGRRPGGGEGARGRA